MCADLSAVVFFDVQQPEPERYLPDSDRIVSGRPEQTTWNHYSDPSGSFHVGIWASEPGCWRIQYTEHEYCRILEGRSILRDNAGNEQTIEAGDEFVIPAGFEGQWEVVKTTRKVYVIFEPTA